MRFLYTGPKSRCFHPVLEDHLLLGLEETGNRENVNQQGGIIRPVLRSCDDPFQTDISTWTLHFTGTLQLSLPPPLTETLPAAVFGIESQAKFYGVGYSYMKRRNVFARCTAPCHSSVTHRRSPPLPRYQ